MNHKNTLFAPNSRKKFQRLLLLFKELLRPWQVLGVFSSSLLLSFMEFSGLALIFPFFKLVTDYDFHHLLSKKAEFVGLQGLFEQHDIAVIVAGFSLILLFIVKGSLHIKLIRYQANIAAEINRKASQGLIEVSLMSRYKLFLDHGAVKITGISHSNTTHASLIFQCLVAAINELVLLSFIFVGAVILSPAVSISVIILILFLIPSFFLPLSRRAAKIGIRTQEIDLARHRFIFAMANAIRDIKIMGLESTFIKRNREAANQHARLAADYVTISAIPRISIEVIMVSAIVLGCIWLVFINEDLLQLAPSLVTGGLMALRAAPALSRLAGSYNGFRYSLPFVDILLDMREEVVRYPQVREDDQLKFKGDYDANNLSFAYGEKLVLEDVSIKLPEGQVIAVIGSSGSGKSALLDLIAGLQPPCNGTFSLGGKNFDPFVSKSFSSRIGYVPQAIAILDASLSFNIALEEAPDEIRLERSIKKAHLLGLVNTLPEGLNTLIGEGGQGISGGQRQRIGIARALYREPSLLILDEVTSALDPVTQELVMGELLQLRGETTLLIVTHDMSAAANADLLYRLEDGHLTLQSRHHQTDSLQGYSLNQNKP